jgi:hypothetical protein
MNFPKLAYTFNGILWNEVTWYSKLGAILICFGVIPALSFYVGSQYQLTMAAIEASGNVPFGMNTSSVRKDVFPAYVANIRTLPSDQGPRPIIAFTLAGNPPTSKENILVDLVDADSKTGDSVTITKPFQMGVNEIDLNSDAADFVSERYLLRVVYYVPGGVLADTRVAAVSQSFEVK